MWANMSVMHVAPRATNRCFSWFETACSHWKANMHGEMSEMRLSSHIRLRAASSARGHSCLWKHQPWPHLLTSLQWLAWEGMQLWEPTGQNAGVQGPPSTRQNDRFPHGFFKTWRQFYFGPLQIFSWRNFAPVSYHVLFGRTFHSDYFSLFHFQLEEQLFQIQGSLVILCIHTYLYYMHTIAYISQPVHPATQLVDFFPTSIMQWYLHKIFILSAWELQYVSITPHWFYICNIQPLYTSNFKNIMM